MTPLSPQTVGERVRLQLEEAERRLGRAPVAGLRTRVGEVVVIASSSRGGSSVLAELLRRTPQLLHFRAEVNPFFALSGLSFPESGTDSDALDPSHARFPQASILDARMGGDVGVPSDDAEGLRRFPGDVALRLLLQWPGAGLDVERVADMAREEVAQSDPRADLSGFHLRLLARVRSCYPSVNPWYYDIPPALVPASVPLPDGPPGGDEGVIEEPPFVTVRPWRPAGPADLASRPLIVKTPSNAYRLDFLRAFFPTARFRVLHLTRNAAASINGLFDGWRYRGFFAHPLPVPLAMADYSDAFGPWARRWWKYDLPPGWRAQTDRPLVEVCAWQWVSAHRAVLGFLERNPDVDVLRLPFESLVGESERRLEAFHRLAEWLRVDLDLPLRSAIEEGMPPVMATTPPRQRRWFQKAALLDRVLGRADILETMEHLGYADDPSTWE